MAKKDKTGRVVRVSSEDTRLFKTILWELEDRGIEKTPDQLADEIFSLGLHTKDKMLRDEKS